MQVVHKIVQIKTKMREDKENVFASCLGYMDEEKKHYIINREALWHKRETE